MRTISLLFLYCFLDLSDRKASYAQRMAEAHLKSSGLGSYTPKQSGTLCNVFAG